MPKQQPIVMEGRVEESLPNVMFRVRLDVNDIVILCHTCGNMKKNFIKILPGDRVKVEMSPYDMEKGRITQRLGDSRPIESSDRSFNGKKRK